MKSSGPARPNEQRKVENLLVKLFKVKPVSAAAKANANTENRAASEAVLNLSWQRQAGRLSCQWSEIGRPVRYNPRWMQEAVDVPSGHLPPLPDFASRSPFGGAFWFQPIRWPTS